MEKVTVGGKVVNLKKGRFGYRIVHPIKDENGKIIYINLLVGGWANFFKIVFIILLFLIFFYGVNNMIASCRDMAENPCRYFKTDCSIHTWTGGDIVTIREEVFDGGDINEGT